MNENDFIRKVLVLAYEYDCQDDLFWNRDLSFFVRCSDVFYWACADLEEITPENIGVLERAMEDAEKIGEGTYGSYLFCARVRKMRPQGAFYDFVVTKELWPLFDACGERRKVDFGNPKEHPDYRETAND